jgi:hypothetical protein
LKAGATANPLGEELKPAVGALAMESLAEERLCNRLLVGDSGSGSEPTEGIGPVEPIGLLPLPLVVEEAPPIAGVVLANRAPMIFPLALRQFTR